MLRLPSSDDLASLKPRFAPYLLHNELHISGRVIRYPKITTGAAHEPDAWLRHTHDHLPVHEPALVAWLFNLGEALRSEPVAFIDIGAAYGYFSLLADLAFARAQIFAVEPNAALAQYIARTVRQNRLTNVRVVNCLVSDCDGHARLWTRNFAFLPGDDPPSGGFTPTDVKMTSLLQLLHETTTARPVVKIDVEGWQVRIIPPAVEELALRRAVVLLECDTAEKVARFGGSNAELAALFLARGYRLFLSDHRRADIVVREVFSAGDELERNALLVMIPPDLAASVG